MHFIDEIFEAVPGNIDREELSYVMSKVVAPKLIVINAQQKAT